MPPPGASFVSPIRQPTNTRPADATPRQSQAPTGPALGTQQHHTHTTPSPSPVPSLIETANAIQTHITMIRSFLLSADRETWNASAESSAAANHVQESIANLASEFCYDIPGYHMQEACTPPPAPTPDEPSRYTLKDQAQTIKTLSQTNAKLVQQLISSRRPEGHPANQHPKQQTHLDTAATRMANTSNVTRSSNPIPIKPTKQNTTFTPIPRPVAPTDRFHDRRLVIMVQPQLSLEDRKHPEDLLTKINAALAAIPTPMSDAADTHVAISIDSVIYSRQGNPIVIAREGFTGNQLLTHARLLTEEIADATSYRFMDAWVDRPRFTIKIDNAPTRSSRGHPYTTVDIESEIKRTWPEYDTLNKAITPTWLASAEARGRQSGASIAFSFDNKADAQRFNKRSVFFVFGSQCRTSKYEERPKVFYCSSCHSTKHITAACKKPPSCSRCGSIDHRTNNHPPDAPLRCSNCDGNHDARDRLCEARRSARTKTSEKMSPPDATPGQRAPTAPANQSAPTGGGRPVGGPKASKKNAKLEEDRRAREEFIRAQQEEADRITAEQARLGHRDTDGAVREGSADSFADLWENAPPRLARPSMSALETNRTERDENMRERAAQQTNALGEHNDSVFGIPATGNAFGPIDPNTLEYNENNVHDGWASDANPPLSPSPLSGRHGTTSNEHS